MNSTLKNELIRLADEDQALIEKLSNTGELANYKDEPHPEIKKIFERNTRRAKEIISAFGWPTISSVGEKASDAMYLIVQHSVLEPEFMQSCVPLLEEQIKNNEAKGWQLAFLQDRTLMQQGKPQIYGTQHDVNKDGIMEPYEIQNPETVNEKRLSLGLERLEEKTKELQERYDATQAANEARKLKMANENELS
ncbi:MAG: hypothetical protein L3K24_10185 [Gammaproteobacteria bacterium]|nr:hypothetical protein [Gammaproteobacteria bacterium]